MQKKKLNEKKSGPLGGRPLQYKENKVACSIRIPPYIKKKIIKKFGKLQNWIDYSFRHLIG